MSGKKHHSCSCCGWSNLTTYRGLRIHQGKMGCTPKGLRIPESAQSNYYPRLTYTPTPIKIEDPYYEITKAPVRPVFEMPPPSYKSLRSLDQRLSTGPSQVGRIMNSTIQMTPPSTQTPMKETNNSLFGNFPVSFRTVTSSHQALPVLDFSTGTLQADVTLSVMSTIQMSSPSTPTQMLETNKSYFQTPPLSYQAVKSSDTARRALDFSTVQVGQLREHLPAAGEETIMDLKKKEKEKAREAEKLLQKSLDSEKLEIDAVFSEVITIVQDAWEEALLPLEKRKKTLKREAQSLVQRLQTEVDRLKDTIDELERDRDAQVFPLQGLDESGWGKSVDTSCSFGTLRATTSTMMKEIQQKLEDLSPLELKRIPAFAGVYVHVCMDSCPMCETPRLGH
ncbi:uncharacterized protein LOC133420463 [Cololabis saira]|uniref:uncharacterized protein LOC133420463 n=1 Tax=Cololabis saira TaxID=129043 RepID=UPI002AD3D82E|nr:uncharacterized protein LOC133420463 [Cololabis saira]